MNPVATLPASAGNCVALTFDDGPDPATTPAVLDILAEEDVPATFFVVGSKAAAHPDVIRRALAQGMGIGIHGWDHVGMAERDRQFVVDQLTRTLEVLWSLDADPCLFRPTYGQLNDTMFDVADQLGLTTVKWDVAPRDWSAPGVEEVVSRVIDAVKAGSIVLMHDCGPGTDDTIAALPKIICGLRENGFTFLELGSCLVPQ